MRSLLLVFTLLPFVFGATLSPNSPFGMGIYFGNRYSPDEMKKAGKMAQDIGVKWSREEFSWGVIQPERDKWDFSRYDMAVDTAYENGISLFGLLDYCATWASTAPEGAERPWFWLPRLEDWQKYVKTTVNRYKDKIKYWEIWNEPNIPTFWQPKPNPDEYFSLLQASYTTIKQVDPTAKVIGVCSAGTDFDFIEAVLNKGGGKYMDIISVHPYRWPSTPEETGFLAEMLKLRSTLQRYGLNIPIWITEVGWPTHDKGVSEDVQARMLVRTYVIAIGSKLVDKVFWYDYRDDGNNPSDPEQNFGIIRRDFTSKKAYNAYKVMTKLLEGKTPEGKVDLWDDNLWGFAFAKGNTLTLVLWAAKEEGTVNLLTKAKKVKVYDMLGKVKEISPKEGKLLLNLSEEPIYVEGLEKAEVGSPPVQFLTSRFRATGGTENEVSVLVENLFNKPAQGMVSLVLPEGWEATPKEKDYQLPAGDYQYLSFKIKPPMNASGDYLLKAVLQTKDGLKASASATIQITQPITLAFQPVLSASLSPALDLIIRNRTSQTLKGTLSISSDELGLKDEKEISLNPGDNKFSYQIGASIQFDKPYDVKATLQIEQLTSTLERLVTFYPCIKTKKAPVIDGEFSPQEWAEAIPIRIDLHGIKEGDWKGPEDLSATAYFLWDDEQAYFAMRVVDDVFNQPYLGGDIWQGDSVQIGLALSPLEDVQGVFYAEGGLALTQRGKLLWVWHAPGIPFEGEFNELNFSIRRQGNEIIYEAAIPYREINFTLSSGSWIGLDIMVNDNDGQGRKCWLEWGKGLGKTKNPRLFWDMVFVEKK
ncbi:cellulase family glycosylhydrolase [bacterium]|nr:cellulase family glycosylhydrolase [bacterium]